MPAAARKHNLFVNSPAGGRALSALQLPLFLMRPPRGYGVLTVTGRKTGKVRRRCVRAVRDGDVVYLVAIKGKTHWARNALANPVVRLRLPGQDVSGHARELGGATETQRARQAYCESVHRFDYLTWINWMKGRPTRAKIRELLREWFEQGTPLVVELLVIVAENKRQPGGFMDFKSLQRKAKQLIDRRGGTDSLKADAEELKDIAKGPGSVTDKAKRAGDALRDPGAKGPDTPSSPRAPAPDTPAPDVDAPGTPKPGHPPGA